MTERRPITHRLKTWPGFFEDVHEGRKTFELRKNDRDFRVGDTLELVEHALGVGPTGRACQRLVIYVTEAKAMGLLCDGVVAIGMTRETEDIREGLL